MRGVADQAHAVRGGRDLSVRVCRIGAIFTSRGRNTRLPYTVSRMIPTAIVVRSTKTATVTLRARVAVVIPRSRTYTRCTAVEASVVFGLSSGLNHYRRIYNHAATLWSIDLYAKSWEIWPKDRNQCPRYFVAEGCADGLRTLIRHPVTFRRMVKRGFPFFLLITREIVQRNVP